MRRAPCGSTPSPSKNWRQAKWIGSLIRPRRRKNASGAFTGLRTGPRNSWTSESICRNGAFERGGAADRGDSCRLLLVRHLRRSLQQIPAEIFQNLPGRQEQAVALFGFDRQRHHRGLIGIRDRLVGPDRIGRQFLFVGHQACRVRLMSGGVASSTSAAKASSVGNTFWPSLPRRRTETEWVSASFLPTTSSAGIFAS